MTKETKDLGAAPPRSLTDSELSTLHDDIRRVLNGSCYLKNLAGGGVGALLHSEIMEVIFKVFGHAPSLISELRRWRDEDAREAKYEWISMRCTQLEVAIRFALSPESGFACPASTEEKLRSALGDGPGTAPEAPPDSSAALLEARRLLGQIAQPKPSVDMADTPEDQLNDALHELALIRERARAFLRSDSERSEPARSESGGSKVVHDPTEEER